MLSEVQIIKEKSISELKMITIEENNTLIFYQTLLTADLYGDHSGVFVCGSWGIKGCTLSAINNPGLELTSLQGLVPQKVVKFNPGLSQILSKVVLSKNM